MVQRKVTYRAELAGGQQVEGGFKKIGDSGRQAYEKIDRGQKSAEKSAKAFERMLDAEERQFKALKASIDPAYAAQMRFERAQAQVNRAVKLGVTSQQEAAEVLRGLETRSRSAATAMELVDTASVGVNRGLSPAAQNNAKMFAYQLNQVAQQGAVTGNYMNALSIQAADMLAVFGLWGVLAGGVTAVMGPLAMSFFDAADGGKEFEDSLADLDLIMSDLGDSSDLLAMDLVELTNKYGAAADRVREFAQFQAQIRVSDAREALQAQTSVLDDLLTQFIISTESGYAFERTIDRISTAFGTSRTEAIALEQILQDMFTASTFPEQQRALEEMVAFLERAGVEANNLPPEFRAAVDRMIELSNATDAAAALARDVGDAAEGISFDGAKKSAEGLVDQLRQAFVYAAGVAQALADNAVYANRVGRGRGGDPRNFGGSIKDWQTNDPRAQLAKSLQFKLPDVAGGGGGAASREANRLDQEALRIRRATTTALEKYNAKMRLAQELLETGRISQEVYNRHVEATKEAYRKASEGQQQFTRYVQQGRDAVINTIMGQKNAFDQLKQAIARAAIEYALYRTIAGQPVTGGIMGLVKSVVGGLLPSFDTRGYTGNGPRSGGVDGKGGMMAVVHPRERWSSDAAGDYRRGSGGRQQDIPFIGIGDGVQVQWMRAAEARSLQQLGGYAQFQRQNFGAMIGELQGRGTL
ncbi:hypothetical protein SAMN05216376_105185 [Mameliella alba]|uniref:hypothetical protein n=1 Tax=Mameliella alba TaxID=561184 RepID=UPI00088BDAD8|nr:hypothetical protein [Mameliella alba]OWV48235.1 hypothetical protein CDZ96_10485 [Mameliella alba]PTR40276.1 hypothetical protein LX94_01758 [Mameliella alba]GGF43674.1 hypothetical protein GCM10011319_01850 [Mameliella alba]SDC97870.1 hypothetical protein SAMN05216376_105185 [Mameliella alba]